MSNLFESPRKTILRAQHHINDLNTKIGDFVNTKPWSYIIEPNADHTLDLHKIKFARRLAPDLPCILFDAANNLRAVLDQVGYASSVASGRVEPKRTQFPFGDDPDGLENVIRRGRCNDLPPEILTLFRACKPYKGGNDALWALNKLCNTKKHCSLVPFAIGSATLTMAIGRGKASVEQHRGFRRFTFAEDILFVPAQMSRQDSRWDPDKYEIVLGRTPANSTSNHQPNVTLQVAIDGIETQSSKPAIAALNEMMRIVDGILGVTEAECRRLGFIK